jgi:hypothetical protein
VSNWHGAKGRLSRRTFLRGVGTAVSLPLLDCMLPTSDAAPNSTYPLRMAFLYVPNGVHMPEWTPRDVGPLGELPPILQSMAPFKKDLLVMSGLAQHNAQALGDGGGDHARAAATFLTGCHPRKTHGVDIKAGVSVDQVAAEKLGKLTRLASLEIGCDKGLTAGNCDSGYSCAYSGNISWRTETMPMAKEVNPRAVFERMFSGGDSAESAAARAKRDRYNKSVLDFVQEDARGLKSQLGMTDQRKLDEYLSGVRDLEARISRAAKQVVEEAPPPIHKPSGIPKEFAEYVRLMCDLLVVAFQGDVTRVSTFMFANDGSNRSYPSIGVPDGHHDVSHHGNDKQKQEKISKINRFHAEQFAYLLGKLKSIREGDGTLLDHSMIVYGSGISDGNRHNHDDLPIILAGNGNGTIRTGRHLRYSKDTPLNNLFLSMLDRLDVPADSLGDSTGRLKNLAG